MKSLLVFIRILVVGILWGIVFTEGIRVIMLCNWHFDIFWPDHWHQAWTLWKAGWVVRAPKEWAFVLLIITFFPMLITGWWTLSMVAWEDILFNIITLPVTLYNKLVKTPVNMITTNNKYGVVKRKSYKQIRPVGVNGIRAPISDYGDTPALSSSYPASTFSSSSAFSSSSYSAPKPAPVKKAPDVSATIDHALFKFDDDDDFDLDIDSFEKTDIKKKESPIKKTPQSESTKKAARFDFDDDEDKIPTKTNKNLFDEDFDDDEAPAKTEKRESKKYEKETRYERSNSSRDDATKDNSKNKRNNNRDKSSESDKSASDNPTPVVAHSPVYDALSQKNYNIITNVSVGSTKIDYVGVSGDEICLCLVDKENGDWLADEEMFNGEEPLWFSESSHRISPVRKLSVARDVISDKLDDEGFEQKLTSFVVIQMANIINADDMFDIWTEMDINVTRINRGSPKEIKLFSKTLNDAGTPMPKKDFDRLRKILTNLK